MSTSPRASGSFQSDPRGPIRTAAEMIRWGLLIKFRDYGRPGFGRFRGLGRGRSKSCRLEVSYSGSSFRLLGS